MKYIVLALIGLMHIPPTAAQEFARVLSATPVMQQLTVPQQVCATERVLVGGQKSGSGAALGVLIGGVAGHALGSGRDRGAATVLGMVGGALVGDRFEIAPQPLWQDIQRCSVQYTTENRVAAYNVLYEFGGKQYSVQLPHDPGPTLALRLVPADAQLVSATPPPMESALVIAPPIVLSPSPQLVYQQPPLVVYQQPVYRSYPPNTNLVFRWGGGREPWGHRHHSDWR